MRAEMTVLRCAMAADRFPTGHCRAAGPAGEAAPRPYTGGAERPRCGLCRHGWAVREPRAVGVRRCLTRRPRGPAIRGGRCRSCRPDRNCGCSTVHGMRRASSAAGEALPRPYMGWRIPGRAFGCDGRAPPPPRRGRVVPGPLTRRAGHRAGRGARPIVPSGSRRRPIRARWGGYAVRRRRANRYFFPYPVRRMTSRKRRTERRPRRRARRRENWSTARDGETVA
jgi:hypothetical protein